MLKNAVTQLLSEAGVEVETLTGFIREIMAKDINLPPALVRQEIEEVFSNTEAAEIILTTVILNIYSNSNLLPEPLQSLIADKKSHLNNMLPLFISNVYGSMGVINYGYIIRAYDDLLDERFTRFNPGMKNMVAGIAAAACTKISRKRDS